MTISLYNTLTRTKETFQTIEPNKVKMYCCGVTVYDYCHLGHGRSYIVWDTIRRYLQWRGYTVNYVQNFTDIDDKILNRAKQENSTMEAVSEKYINAYYEDLRSLNVLDADQYPRVTTHISAIHQLIEELIHKGYAYPVEGDVYYRVRKFPEYGKLSGRKFDEMRAGGSGRVDESDPESRKKEDPFDFALWKGAKEDEPSWDSPWGKGRPGWHIECSAMIRHQLGETIDIHGGGGDLVFPHHENEIAQSEGAHDHPLANYWLHNGMVTVNGEKMSKSLGNFTTIRDLLGGGVSPMAIRLFVLTAQYRKPIDFNDEAIKSAESSWQTIKEGLLFGYQYGEQLGWSDPQEIPLVEPILTEFPPQENVFVENPLQSIDIKPIIGEEVLSSFQKILRGLFLPFIKFPDYFHRFIQEYRQYAIIALLLYLSQFPIRITLGFLESINSLPLVSELFETVGLLVIGRYLLYKSVREKTNSQIQELITKITTKPTDVDNSKSSSNKYIDRFQRAIDDDFNFAEGLAVIFELAKDLRKEGNLLVHQGKTQTAPQILKTHWETLLLLTNVLGLEVDVTEINQNNHDGLSDGEIEDLITQRKIARDNKDFSTSDRIRDELKAQGITLIDQSGGITTWHR